MLFKQFENMQEQQQNIQNENKELRNQLSELIPKIGNTVNNVKQKFNINILKLVYIIVNYIKNH